MELNSAVGTLDDPKKEEQLEKLINQLSQSHEALGGCARWEVLKPRCVYSPSE